VSGNKQSVVINKVHFRNFHRVLGGNMRGLLRPVAEAVIFLLLISD